MTEERDPDAKGFLQLCADRRYHRKTMEAFERETGLNPEEYFIEARAGGAPAWGEPTRVGRIAYRLGARVMGWAAHGDTCRGFYGASDGELRRKLEATARHRAADFPQAAHFLLFGAGGDVEVQRVR